ncbi:MAG: hypothetical protein ACRCVW_03380 [Brevinema sp.]
MTIFNFEALYILYISIFIEQSLEKESFTYEDEIDIANISYCGFLTTYALSKSNLDIEKTMNFISSHYPANVQEITKKTLEDMIILYPELVTLSSELIFFQKLSVVLMKYNESLLKKTHFELLEDNIDDLFSYTMYTYESLLLLDQKDYHLEETLKYIEDNKDNNIEDGIIEILQSLKL